MSTRDTLETVFERHGFHLEDFHGKGLRYVEVEVTVDEPYSRNSKGIDDQHRTRLREEDDRLMLELLRRLFPEPTIMNDNFQQVGFDPVTQRPMVQRTVTIVARRR